MRLGVSFVAPTSLVLAGSRAILAQEIRNARGGQYILTIRAAGRGTSVGYFEAALRRHFACRLVLFRYSDAEKNPLKVAELAAETFVPTFAIDGEWQTFTVSRFLGSTMPNVNFTIGNGLGIAVELVKTSLGILAM